MKKRSKSHLIDEKGTAIFEACLPTEWVVRPYQPDYGIDFEVEVFEPTSNGGAVALGEHLFVQLKSKQAFVSKTKKVRARYNVEKHALRENNADHSEISVWSMQVKRDDIELALSMGPAASYLLVACDISDGSLRYVCLTDYAEKIILPKYGGVPKQDKITVHLPDWCKITGDIGDVIALSLFARRAKLYAAFNKIRYQRNEIKYVVERFSILQNGDVFQRDELQTIKLFIEVLKRYDFWETTHAWSGIALSHLVLQTFEKKLNLLLEGQKISDIYAAQIGSLPVSAERRVEMAKELCLADILATWNHLANLGNVFEEICREWFLPTHLANLVHQNSV